MNESDSTQRGDKAADKQNVPNGAVSNTATTLEVPSDGAATSESGSSIAESTEEAIADGQSAVEPAVQASEKTTDPRNPFQRLMIWKNDSSSKTESIENEADANAATSPDQNAPGTNPDAGDEPKQPLRSRGQRLLSMLRFPWGNEEPEELDIAIDGVSPEDADSEPAASDSLPGEVSDEQQLTDGEDSAAEPVDSELTGTAPEELPKARGPQPWSESEPSAVPTGVSNQAIATLADFNEDESADDNTQIAGDEAALALGNPARHASPIGQTVPRGRPLADRTHAPVEALRRAIFPETPLADVDTNDIDEQVVTVDQQPVAVVKIPNRLPAPKVRGITKPWPSKLADRSVLLIGSVVGVALLFAWGLWRRARAGDEV